VKDWNIVISVYQDGFRRALRALKEFGRVERSPYHNVLVMKVEDPTALLEAIERKTEENTALYDAISRIAPAMRAIEFHSVEEFEDRIKSILLERLPRRLEVLFTCVCTGVGIDTICQHQTPSVPLTTSSWLQRRRQVRRARFPSRIRTRHRDRHGRRSRRCWTVVT